MTALLIDPIAKSWKDFNASSGVGHIRSEAQYNQVTELMNQLVDLGAMNDGHELHDLLMLAGDVIQQYEAEFYPNPSVTGVEVLRFLMNQHGLKQADLAEEFGSQSVVSEILAGKRDLNKSHIQALATRFKVSPAVFF